MKVDIIGAGIGGLTTAICLKQKGIQVNVYEQAKELKPVGAGIILANNAMQVFQKWGLKEAIAQNGNPISSLNITTPDLAKLSSVDLSYFESKYNCKNIAIHRASLQEILLDRLEPDTVQLDHKLVGIDCNSSQCTLKFENGKEISSDVLIGADGLNSVVRQQIFSNTQIRNTYQVCWRGIVDHSLPKDYQSELNEAWGQGDRFGFVSIATDKVYWYALKSFKQDPNEYLVERLPQYFSGYSHIIQDIISSTPIESIHTATIDDLKPMKEWSKGTICLIGDAAHATTPNMGQGACQAIEDANILAECLDRYEVRQAFSVFEKLRRPKANKVVSTSWKIGKMAHWKNPIATRLRDQLIKLTPDHLGRIQSERIFKLETV